MSAILDTSILIDVLRGHPGATEVLRREKQANGAHASEITRLEVLAGMRKHEERPTRLLLGVLRWHPVDEAVAEEAGALGRAWLPSHGAIDAADLAIAATAVLMEARLLTTNLRHFPMFPGLSSPY